MKKLQKAILIAVILFICGVSYAQMPRWTEVRIPIDSLNPSSVVFLDSLHGYFGALKSDMTSLYYNGKMFWFQTSDGGKHWNQIINTIIALDSSGFYFPYHYTQLLYANLTNQYMYLGDSDGCYFGGMRRLIHSGDGGKSWSVQNSWHSPSTPPQQDLNLLSSLPGEMILAFNQSDHSIYASYDGGKTFPARYWDNIFRSAVYPGYPKDSSYGVSWISFDNSDLNTWTVALTLPQSTAQVTVPFGLQTLVSTDFGTNWEYHNTPVPGELSGGRISGFLQYIKGTPYVYYFTGFSREGLRFHNIYNNWAPSGPMLGISFLYSSDYGRSWTIQNAYGKQRRAYEAVRNGEVWMTAAVTDSLTEYDRAYKIIRTKDNGMTWDIDSTSLYNDGFYDGRIITFSDPRHGWIAALNGQQCSIFRYDANEQPINGVQNTNANEDYTIYPNPANEEMTIQTNATVQIKSLEFFDILGRKWSCPYEIQGNKIALVHTGGLQSGSYVAHVILQGGSAMIRFVVQH